MLLPVWDIYIEENTTGNQTKSKNDANQYKQQKRPLSVSGLCLGHLD